MKIAEDLREKLHRTRLVESAVVRQMDVFAFLREAPTPFGVIFCGSPDPSVGGKVEQVCDVSPTRDGRARWEGGEHRLALGA
jgi:hypothetical protein